MLQIAVYLLLFGITYFIVNYYREGRRLHEFQKKFDGPKPLPIVGNVLNVGTTQPEIFHYVMQLFHKYPKNCIMHGFFHDYTIVITNLDDLETILKDGKMTEKSVEYTFLIKWLGTGLLIASGKKWFTRRKILTPSFHFNILESYVGVFNKQSKIFVQKLKKFATSGDEFDVHPKAALSALDVISEASMGVEINAQNDPNSKYVKSVKRVSQIFFQRVFSVLKMFPKIYEYTPLGYEENKHIKLLHKFTNDVILKRREKLLAQQSQNIVNDVNSDDIAVKKKMSLLDMLLSASVDGEALSNEDIREEVDTFMFAGHDTTTAAMSFMLYALSKNPEVQQKLYDEVKNGFNDKENFTMKELNDLQYFDLVLKETLRMYPPVPVLGRRLLIPAEFNGALLPAGTNLLIPVYGIHHSPAHFSEPERFYPERFQEIEKHPFCYIPFSAGNRNCIGQKFAQLEIKAIISNILLNYKILPVDASREPIIMGDIVLKSQNGINIKIAKRTK